MDDDSNGQSGHAPDELLQKGYDARDSVWNGVGKLDSYVLAHMINPSFQGMPEWPDLRQSYKIIHLENGHTIIATDGLSDPFMKDHKFYKPDVNGFGLELYIEITEPFDMGSAGYTWWYNLLYQEALQVAYSGDLLENLEKYGGMLSTELYDVNGLPDERKKDGRAPILIGAPSNVVPSAVGGPLSPIRFVSIALLTLDELDYVIANADEGRQRIAQGLAWRFGSPISALDRSSVLVPREEDQIITNPAVKADGILTIDVSGTDGDEKELFPESVSRLESLLKVQFPSLDAYWADTEDIHSFYTLFFDVLLDDEKCAMDIDWKWEPGDIFWQLEKLLPDHQIKLTKSEDNEIYVAYNVEFTFDGKTEKLTADFENPNDIIAIINSHLTDKQFIDVWFGEDRYSWLLAPRDMDTNVFTEITGLYVKNTPSPHEERTLKLRAEPETVPPITASPSPAPAEPALAEPKAAEDELSTGSIDVTIKQAWVEKSSDTALEEFKSVFADTLNSLPEDRFAESRWSITKVSEGDAAHLVYDERSIATLKFENTALRFTSQENMPRYDDVMYSLRYAANRLMLAVYSHKHNGARLPQDSRLGVDATYFHRDKDMARFFEGSKFIPRFAIEGVQNVGDGRQALVIYPPYYVEHKEDGSIHITNDAMLKFLLEKDDQRTNREFSYKVADSMQDFARKYDLGLVPSSFYQNYERSTKIINDTYFDIDHINRKVFIDPYVWDFDDEHDYRFYKNVKKGQHIMDKVRKGETLDSALKRLLREELEVASDYVAARVVGLDFDKDRDGYLTPRLVMNVFVHGMAEKHRSQSHDWVSIK